MRVFGVCLRVTFFIICFQNASNKQCSMCGPAMETHTVHRPVGHSLISLVQQVMVSSWTCFASLDKKSVFLMPCHFFFFFFQGLLVVSHLGPGLLWWHCRQYDRHSLVLHNTGSFDTNIPQNSSVVSRALISLLPSLVPGDERFNLSLNKWWRLV